MKDRNIICKFYQWHGQCEKGKKADLTGYCTHCGLYEKKFGVKPFRTDTRRTKLEKINKKERGDYHDSIRS